MRTMEENDQITLDLWNLKYLQSTQWVMSLKFRRKPRRITAAWGCLRWLVQWQTTEMESSKKAVARKVEEKLGDCFQLKTYVVVLYALLCARHCSKCWWQGSERDIVPAPTRLMFIVVGGNCIISGYMKKNKAAYGNTKCWRGEGLFRHFWELTFEQTWMKYRN